jgi:hypothetical protein
MVGEAAQDRQSLPSGATRCDLCTICLTGGFYSEFTGMFSANRCVTDTITKNASTLQVRSMRNLIRLPMNQAAIRNLIVCTIPLAR